MNRSVEITAVMTDVAEGGEGFHNFHWLSELEISLDCFICERRNRTTSLALGDESGVCHSGGDVKHPAPIRIVGFDHTTQHGRSTLRAVVEFWWAQSTDKKTGEQGTPLPPWVRLNCGYYCRKKETSGRCSTQSNIVRPHTGRCDHCGVTVATSAEAPSIRLLT
jgi:hypothetical protein